MHPIVCGGCGKEIARRQPNGMISLVYKGMVSILEYGTQSVTCGHYTERDHRYVRDTLKITARRCGYVNRFTTERIPAGAAS